MKNKYHTLSLCAFILTTICLLIMYLIKASGMILIGVSFFGYLITLILYLLSKKNKTINKLLIIFFLSSLLLGIFFSVIDYYLIKNNKNPLFSLLLTQYKDGGSKEYWGLGYKIIRCHNLNGDNSNNMGFYNLNINSTCTGSEDIYSLYKKAIDNLMRNGDYSKSEYLALDIKSFKLLDSYYEDLLLEYVKKYNQKILKSTYNELIINGYADEEGLNLKGHLISINEFKKFNNRITFKIERYNKSLGAKGFCYKATFKNNDWSIKETCMFVS